MSGLIRPVDTGRLQDNEAWFLKLLANLAERQGGELKFHRDVIGTMAKPNVEWTQDPSSGEVIFRVLR